MIGLKLRPRRHVAGENTFVERVAKTQKMRHDYVRGERARRQALYEAEYQTVVAEMASYQINPANCLHPPAEVIRTYLRLTDRTWNQFFRDVRRTMHQQT